jgi:hypothetical protein
MKRHALRYQEWVAYSLFIGILIVVAFDLYHIVVKDVAEAADRTEALEPDPPAWVATRPAAAAPRPSQRRDYTPIVRRNLFQPLIAPCATTAARPVKPAPAQARVPSAGLQVTLPPRLTDEPVHDPVRDQIAVVGSLQIENEWYALIEDLVSKDTGFVRVGESAFDYTLKAATADGVVLERDGRTFTMTIGENKVIAPVKWTVAPEENS